MEFLRRHALSILITVVAFTPVLLVAITTKQPERTRKYDNDKNDADRGDLHGKFAKQYSVLRLRREDLEKIILILAKSSVDYVMYVDDYRIPNDCHLISVCKERTKYFRFVSNSPQYDLVLAKDGARLQWTDDSSEAVLSVMLSVDRLLAQRTMAVQQIDRRIAGITFAVAGFIADPIFSFFQVDVFGAARQHHYVWLYNTVGVILITPLIYSAAFHMLIDYSRHCVIDLSQRRQLAYCRIHRKERREYCAGRDLCACRCRVFIHLRSFQVKSTDCSLKMPLDRGNMQTNQVGAIGKT